MEFTKSFFFFSTCHYLVIQKKEGGEEEEFGLSVSLCISNRKWRPWRKRKGGFGRLH